MLHHPQPQSPKAAQFHTYPVIQRAGRICPLDEYLPEPQRVSYEKTITEGHKLSLRTMS